MMLEQSLTSEVKETVNILLKAVKEQPGNVEEIFQLITQLPHVTGNYLPFDLLQITFTDDNENASNSNAHKLFDAIAKWYTDRLKHLVEECNENEVVDLAKPGKIETISQSMECLIILGGQEYAKEKLANALSRKTDLILQNGMEYVAEPLENIKMIEENFTSVILNVKMLSLDAIFILFSCEGLCLETDDQLNFISDPILEKLSVELLTLVDSLKGAVFKSLPNTAMKSSIGSTSHTNLFTALTATIGEDAYFNSHELLSLAVIISLFLDMEKSLQQNEYTRLLKAKSKSERSRKSSLKCRSQLPDLLRSSQESSWIRSSQIYGNWNWQEILKDIGPIIVKSIGKVFDDCQTNAINSARNAYHLDCACKLPIVPSISSTILSGPGIPKQTMACYGEILNLMKCLLPYAVLGSQYKPLSGLCSCYVDECGQSLKSMKSFLMTIISDVPSKTPIFTLYHVLSTCEDVCTMLSYCASKMDSEPRIPFQGIIQSYRDLNNTVKNTIMQNQSAKLSTYILNDAESHHWSDPREFNEEESCSYSIKMWNLFLKQLLVELGSCVSEGQKSKIFEYILSKSLQVLEQRYIKCEPSYNRTKQIGVDISTILTICRNFMFRSHFHPHITFLNDLPESMLDVRLVKSQIMKSCETLTSVLCFVSCPLEVVEKCLSPRKSHLKTHNWLSLMDPSMFPHGWNGYFSDISDVNALLCVLELTCYKPMSLINCFYSLVLRNSFLLRKILSEEFASKASTAESLECDIYTIFSSCSLNFSEVFFQCAYTSVDEDPKLLLNLCIPNVEDTFSCVQSWQKEFISALQETLCKSLGAVARYVCNLTWSSFGLVLIRSLPASQNSLIVDLSGQSANDDTNDCELACILLLIQGVEMAMHTLPDWITVFLKRAGDVLKNSPEIYTIFDNGAFHIMIHAICSVLNTPNLWEQHHGIELNRQGIEFMQCIANHLLNFCGRHTNKAPLDLEVFVIKELHNLEQKFASCCDSRIIYEYSDEQFFDACQYQVSHFEVRSKKALESLRRVSNVLHEYHSVIHKICNGQTPSVDFSSDITDFNPIAEWNIMNKNHSVHDGELKNWQVMCGRVSAGAKSFLYNRWEMKEGAYLTDGQADIVKRLKQSIG